MWRGILGWLLGAAALAAVAILLGFALPQRTVVERADDVAAPPATVYQLLVDLKAARRWSPWRDARSRYLFSGPPMGVGAHMEWSGPSLGSTTVIQALPYSLVKQWVVRNGEPRTSTIRLTPTAQGAHVTWRMETDGGGNPVSRWRNWLYQTQSQVSLERGLDRLRDVAEALPHVDLAQTRVALVQRPPARLAYVAGETSPDPEAVGRALAQGSGRARSALRRAGLKPASGSVWSAETVEGGARLSYRAGVAFDGEGAPAAPGLEVADLPGGAAVQAHAASPAELPQAQAAIALFRSLHQLAPSGPVSVEFVKDPGSGPAVLSLPVAG